MSKRIRQAKELANRILLTADQWKANEYRLTNSETKEWFWIASGASHLTFKGAGRIFTSRQKKIIWAAIQQVIIERAVKWEEE